MSFDFGQDRSQDFLMKINYTPKKKKKQHTHTHNSFMLEHHKIDKVTYWMNTKKLLCKKKI